MSVTLDRSSVDATRYQKIRCEFHKKKEDGTTVKCNRLVTLALQVAKCHCDRYYCSQHFSKPNHECPVASSATQVIAKSAFHGHEISQNEGCS